MISLLISSDSVQPNLPQAVQSARNALSRICGKNFEIILVAHGPHRFRAYEQFEILKEKVSEHTLTLHPPVESGRVPALKAAFDASRGDWVAIWDAENRFGEKFLEEAIRDLRLGQDLVTANRRLPSSRFNISAEDLTKAGRRHRTGLMLNRIVRWTLGIKTLDTQARAKVMSRALATKIFAECGPLDTVFDIETHLIASKYGFAWSELPVSFSIGREKSLFEVVTQVVEAGRWLPRAWLRSIRGAFRPNVLSRYRSASLPTRFFLWLRFRLTPYLEMARHFPRSGKILDLACGHGLLSLTLGLTRPRASILGVDHDSVRIALASLASKNIGNILLDTADFESTFRRTPEGEFAGIACIDALHYLSAEAQEQVLRESYRSLRPGGVLVMREVNPSAGSRSWINRLYEKLATSIGFTQASVHHHMRSPSGWVAALESAGFSVSWTEHPSLIFSDICYVATKPLSVEHRASTAHGLSRTTLSRRTVMTADDWGLTPAVNRGILTLAQRGWINRVSVLSDAPYADHLLPELKQIPGIQIGLHFNLTYGPGRPSPMALLISRALDDSSTSRSEIATQFSSQLDQLERFGIQTSHIDGHHHVHIFPGVLETVIPIAKKRGVLEFRLPADPRLWVSPRFPLALLSCLARVKLEQNGIGFRRCFYPSARHFKNSEILRAELHSKQGYEFILHPAIDDDLAKVGCEDPYRRERVQEYQALQSLMNWEEQYLAPLGAQS